jgi:hypothetical protein
MFTSVVCRGPGIEKDLDRTVSQPGWAKQDS